MFRYNFARRINNGNTIQLESTIWGTSKSLHQFKVSYNFRATEAYVMEMISVNITKIDQVEQYRKLGVWESVSLHLILIENAYDSRLFSIRQNC